MFTAATSPERSEALSFYTCAQIVELGKSGDTYFQFCMVCEMSAACRRYSKTMVPLRLMSSFGRDDRDKEAWVAACRRASNILLDVEAGGSWNGVLAMSVDFPRRGLVFVGLIAATAIASCANAFAQRALRRV